MALFVDLVVRQILTSAKMRHTEPAYVRKVVLKELPLHLQLRKLVALPSIDERVVRRKEVKKFIRHVRGILFRRYGVFQSTHVDRREEILQRMRHASLREVRALCDVLLHLHASSRERLGDYARLYKHIFACTGKPQRILDVGSGMNPISFPSMNLDHVAYTAIELNKNDCAFLQSFFHELHRFYLHLTFQALALDISDPSALEKIRSLGDFDVAFLLKMSDAVEERGHKRFEGVLMAIRAASFVVSFPTRTLSNKRMRQPRRRWFEVMARRCGFTFDSFELPHELFYVLKRFS